MTVVDVMADFEAYPVQKSLAHKTLSQCQHCVGLCIRALDVEVVLGDRSVLRHRWKDQTRDVELGMRVEFTRLLESQRDVFFAHSIEECVILERSVIIERFIDDIPKFAVRSRDVYMSPKRTRHSNPQRNETQHPRCGSTWLA